VAGDSNINMVIGQGNAVKEIYNVKKQDLEVQQQTGMQESIKKNREEKTKIQETGSDTKIQVKGDENRESQEHLAKKRKKKDEEQEQADENRTDSSFIDIIA
jgi:hypothetical protein